MDARIEELVAAVAAEPGITSEELRRRGLAAEHAWALTGLFGRLQAGRAAGGGTTWALTDVERRRREREGT